MLILTRGKSYIQYFYITTVAFLLSAFVGIALWRNGSTALPVLTVALGCIVIAEIRSGIALDRRWTAVYLRGTKSFQLVVAWHSLVLLISVLFCALNIRDMIV